MLNLLKQLQAWYLRNFTYKGKTWTICTCDQLQLLQIYKACDGSTIIYLGNDQVANT